MIYYRYIYKITCLCKPFKGYYYIGQHSTYDMNDGYAGSGLKINEYYKQYGKILGVTYTMEIIKNGAKSQSELDKWEKQYIDKHLGKKKCLNMIEGGLDAIKRRQKESKDYYMNENGNLISCDNINEEDEINNIKQKFDNITTQMIKQLERDKHNIELRIELLKLLSKYGLTPSLLNL